MDDDTKHHATFLILSHLIFVYTYRDKLLLHDGDEMKQIFKEIAARSDCSFEAMEVDQDHIHCLVKSEHGMAPRAMVRRLKQEATMQFWREHERE